MTREFILALFPNLSWLAFDHCNGSFMGFLVITSGGSEERCSPEDVIARRLRPPSAPIRIAL